MKKIIFLFLLVSTQMLFAQSEKVSGNYETKFKTEESQLEYLLTLSSDGTFVFHYYSDIKNGNPQEIHKYAKGNWSEKDNIISFVSNPQTDIDEKYTLDFSNSKARFITKSPRDKSDKVVNTSLQFLASEIKWIKPIKLLKT